MNLNNYNVESYEMKRIKETNMNKLIFDPEPNTVYFLCNILYKEMIELGDATIDGLINEIDNPYTFIITLHLKEGD